MERTKIQNDKMFMLQDEIYSDSIIPFVKKELKRTVNLFGKVTLKGGIYCQNLEVEAGDIYVQKSVYAEEGLLIKGDSGGQVWFQSPVNCEHSILVDEKSDMRVRFGKTIRAKSINLFNTIVYGNVIGDNISLKNSVVLGGAFANNNLTIDNSIVGTYHCPTLKHVNNMGVLYPMAISDKSPELSDKIFMVVPGSFTNGNNGGVFKLSKDDFYPLKQGENKKYVFSNTMRIFDLRAFYLNLQENIERLFDVSSNNGDEIEDLKDSFKDFDNKYFVFIDKNFSTSKSAWSDFMDVKDEVVEDYFGEEHSTNETVKTNKEQKSSKTAEEDLYSWVDSGTNESDTSNEQASIVPPEVNQSESISTEDIKQFKNGDFVMLKEDAYETPLLKHGVTYKVIYESNQGVKLEEYPNQFIDSKHFVKVTNNLNETIREESSTKIQRCPDCNSVIESGFMFCSECGKKIN